MTPSEKIAAVMSELGAKQHSSFTGPSGETISYWEVEREPFVLIVSKTGAWELFRREVVWQ